MLDPHLVFLGAACTLAGSGYYAVQTLRGRARPNRVTWFLWALAPLIGFAAELDRGVGLPAVLTLSVGLGPALVFCSSLVASGYWRVSGFDVACGAVSLTALVAWLSADDPTTAVALAVLADLMGGVPTFVKTWVAPWTEPPPAFLAVLANGTITLLTIDRWDVATAGFPAYIAALGAGMVLLIGVRRRALGPREPGV